MKLEESGENDGPGGHLSEETEEAGIWRWLQLQNASFMLGATGGQGIPDHRGGLTEQTTPEPDEQGQKQPDQGKEGPNIYEPGPHVNPLKP